MRRRDVLKLFAGAAIATQGGASAQTESKTYRVGLLSRGAVIADASPIGAALIRALGQRGYSLDRNLAFERRGAEMRVELLPRLVDELVASKVDVIFAVSYPAALAAKKGTTLPVVVFSTGDPVATGLVDSLARPGGNITGISDLTVELSPKRLQFLKEMTPGLRRVAMLWNADGVGAGSKFSAIRAGTIMCKHGLAPRSRGVTHIGLMRKIDKRVQINQTGKVNLTLSRITYFNGREISLIDGLPEGTSRDSVEAYAHQSEEAHRPTASRAFPQDARRVVPKGPPDLQRRHRGGAPRNMGAF